MARIRTIKPEFFTSEDIVGMTPYARLLYIALWCEADKAGRLCWKPATFKMRYMPGDNVDIGALCKEIIDAGLVVLYGDGLAHIPTFSKHQHVNPRETASKLPDIDASPRVSDASILDLHAQVGREGKGKEGKGREETLSAQSPDEPIPEIPEDRRKREPSADDVNLAGRIFGLILQTNPTAKKPNFAAWADDIRLMREIDKRPLPEIWSLFQWVRKDAFWRANVMSPAKLREKWDQLTEKRAAPAQPRRGAPVINEKFNFDHLDRSGDAIAMAESMRRHGIVVPPEGEEIEI
jgi:hypothetical protein